MKKLAAGVLVVVLLVLATSVASAAQPPGVDVSVRVEGGACVVGFSDSDYRWTRSFTQFSNGATGHTTWKCKFELVQGPPQYEYWEFGFDNCSWTLSIDGKKGMLTQQCFGDWHP